MSIADKLTLINAAKLAQRAALIEKGVDMDAIPFSAYDDAIRSIVSGVTAVSATPIFRWLSSLAPVITSEPTAGNVWYVVPGGSGDRNGTSWDNAFARRSEAVEAASAGDRIYVMEGLYYLDTVQIPKLGVSEYYGFSQRNPSWLERNPYVYPSKLDACYTSNHWRNDSVVFAPGQVVDGLWVQNVVGASGIVSMQSGRFRNVATVSCVDAINGGGMYFVSCFVDKVFATKCSCVTAGGGVYITGTGSLTGCVCTNNTAGSTGGGLYLYGTISLSDCLAQNCTSGFEGGGGIRALLSVAIDNCLIVNCSTTAQGGGIYLQSGATLTRAIVNNCTSGNAGGGGVCLVNSGELSNSVIANCRANTGGNGGLGGGVRLHGGASKLNNTTCINCTSTAPNLTGFYIEGQQAAISNCVAYGCSFYMSAANYAYKLFNCASNLPLTGVTDWGANADVRNFVELTEFPFAKPGDAPWNAPGVFNNTLSKSEDSLAYIDNIVLPSMPDVHLSTGSPLIGAGYYEEGVTPTTDADGKTRPVPPSIGAYEP